VLAKKIEGNLLLKQSKMQSKIYMKHISPNDFIKKAVITLLILQVICQSYGQSKDSTRIAAPIIFSGTITATNNGISLLPNFSLNKPALLFDLSMAKGRVSFDPMFRFAMEGKPWTFVFWGRYKLINKKNFSMGIGAHPSFVFKTITVASNGTSNEYLTTQRYLAWEASPTFYVNKNINVGIYYLGSHGLTNDLTQYTTFIAAKSTFSNINISDKLRLAISPQFYYLKQDEKDGIYVTGTVALSKKNSPFSISSIVSKSIQTEIAGKDFVWNIALNYYFKQ
jgi:hypothetical protein